MAVCILINHATQAEIGRREMQEHEHYQLCEECRDHALIHFNGAWYRAVGGLWNRHTEEMRIQVTFDSWAAGYCDC